MENYGRLWLIHRLRVRFLFYLRIMSSKSTSKIAAFNEENEALYENFQAIQLPDYFPAEPPWPEWKDAEINSETWGDVSKLVSQNTNKSKSEMTLDSFLSYYRDPDPGILPFGLDRHVTEWKRPHEIFPLESLKIYDANNSDLKLKTISDYSSNCELFKKFSDFCCLLQFYAAMEPFPVENETPYFTSNTRGQSWKPWHHIYGNSKAGKDQPHQPVYYRYGKYFVRMFYLGRWRKFTIDDQIPCDVTGKCMLPVTSRTGELWPILLIKAILKITSLTPASKLSAMNLPMWSLFTGWLQTFYPTTKDTSEEIWRMISVLSPHFILPDQSGNSESRVTSMSSKGTKKEEEVRPVLMLAELGNFLPESKFYGNVYLVPLLMTRDIPLVRAKARKPTEPWKRIRWVHWATKKGIWTDEEFIPPYRCLYVINFEKELFLELCVDPEVENRLFILEHTDAESVLDENTPLQWFDFFKLFKRLSSITFAIKPSSLLSSCKMTYINLDQVPTTAGGSKTKPAPIVATNSTYYMLPTLKISGNNAPIVYCESDSGIFICFSLWVSPREKISMHADQPDFLRHYHGSLLVETYDWRSMCQNKIVAAAKTVGCSTTNLYLNPGRHALRIWCDTDSQFVIDIYSNTELVVGKGQKIHFGMSTESLLITNYLNKLSNAFIELTQKYGRPNYAKSLSQFYDLAKPSNALTIGYFITMKNFVNVFSVCVFTVLRTLVANEEELRWMAKALQSLFINPNIPCPSPKPQSNGSALSQKKKKEPSTPLTSHKSERVLSNTSDREWTDEEVRHVVTIQRIFRGFRVRKLLRYQSPSHKEHKIIVEKLKNICDMMFSHGKRDVEVARLIREVISTDPTFLETFIFFRDIPNVIVTEEFTGKIPGVEPKAWVPMIRFIFACHSPDPLPCAFFHSCNLEQYIVTVTDNDTNEEIFRLVNAACPHYYTRNKSGYTIFIYGWNESDTKTVNWRLEMIKMKYFLDIHPCNTTLIGITGNTCHPYQPQPLSMLELRNFYIPNKQNRICTCLIKVRRRILVTLRLSASFEDARFFVRIYVRPSLAYSDSDTSIEDDIVIETEAKSSAIIFPSILLHHFQNTRATMDSKEEKNDQTVYVLEAFVIYNSWPLTKREWGVVEPIRVFGESWQENAPTQSGNHSRKSSTGSRKKTIRSLKTSVGHVKTIESPYWHLQIVTDLPPELSSALELSEDKSYQEMIKRMKQMWEEKDPGRRQRGKLIQSNFLRQIYEEKTETRKTSSDMVVDNQRESLDTWRSNSSSFALGSSFDGLIHEMRSFTYLVNDKSNVRYLKSPRLLPCTPLQDLMMTYSRRKHDVDAVNSEETSRIYAGEDCVLPIIHKQPHDTFKEGWKKLLGEMRCQRAILENHFNRENSLSTQLMDQACDERRKLIERMKDGGK